MTTPEEFYNEYVAPVGSNISRDQMNFMVNMLREYKHIVTIELQQDLINKYFDKVLELKFGSESAQQIKDHAAQDKS